VTAAFFDLDGCLVDSRAPISAAMNAALRDLGLPERDPVELYGYIGPPLLASFQQLLRSLEADPALAEQAVTAYRRVYPDPYRGSRNCSPNSRVT
jgi:phosphoglycolate phosphatase